MAMASSSSENTAPSGAFAGDPICTRGLREALERLERQIGRIGEIANEKETPQQAESGDFKSDPALCVSAPSIASETFHSGDEDPEHAIAVHELEANHKAEVAQLRTQLTAEVEEANSRCATAEQRAQSMQSEATAAVARADELARQVSSLEEQLQKRQAAPTPAPAADDPELHKQVTTLQAELRLIRKERDQLMTRLQREETRLQRAGISIEWDKSPAKAKTGKAKRRSSG